MEKKGVAVVVTLLNEEKNLPAFLNSLLHQTRTPEEILLVDGGSRDRSCEVIWQYISNGAPIKLMLAKGANRSKGRNAGIAATKQPIIASCDVGCRLLKDWLEKIVAPLEAGACEVAGGYYMPDTYLLMERAVAAATLPIVTEVDPKTFLPSSRSIAFLRTVWEKVGGYPEAYSMNEDTVFDLALRRAGARFVLVPEALVLWKQHGKLKDLYSQYFRYARGDAGAGVSFAHYAKASFLVFWLGLLFVLTLSLIFVLPLVSKWAFRLLLLTLLAYAARYLLRSRKRGWDWPAALLSPVAMMVVDFANFMGYQKGKGEKRKGSEAPASPGHGVPPAKRS